MAEEDPRSCGAHVDDDRPPRTAGAFVPRQRRELAEVAVINVLSVVLRTAKAGRRSRRRRRARSASTPTRHRTVDHDFRDGDDIFRVPRVVANGRAQSSR